MVQWSMYDSRLLFCQEWQTEKRWKAKIFPFKTGKKLCSLAKIEVLFIWASIIFDLFCVWLLWWIASSWRYVGWPAAKAHVAVLTGSLRNLQKLVASIDDEGNLGRVWKSKEDYGERWKRVKVFETFLDAFVYQHLITDILQTHLRSFRKETEYRALLWQIATAQGT